MPNFAVVGSPIAHSLSPVMHRAAYRHLGASDAQYTAIEVPGGQLAAFLRSEEGARLAGLSVTMPLKGDAYECAHARDETSTLLGISNTLIRFDDPDGVGYRAENHDVEGIVQSLLDHGLPDTERQHDGAVEPGPRRAAILGSGATAASAMLALARLSMNEVALTARSSERLQSLHRLGATLGLRTREIPWERASEALAAPVVISALALPGAQALAAHLEARHRDGHVVPAPPLLLDVLYEPWPAPIAQWVQARGAVVASGIEMLAHQAARQVESMLGVPSVTAAVLREAAEAELAARSRGRWNSAP